MAFLGDLFDSITNQQVAPQQTIIPTNELLGQAYGTLNSTVAPGIIGFNQALAPGLTDVQLGVANQIDPSILSNFRGANKSILDQLNMGSSMSPELQAEITRNLLATNANTGFGASAGGVGNILYQTASDKEALRQMRVKNALGAGTSGIGVAQSFYNPLAYTQIGQDAAAGVAQNIQGVQAAKDEAANMAENVRRQNFSALINTGGRILGGVVGGVVGAYTGNAAGGVMAGQSIGGSLGGSTGVAGYGGIGGPQQGIGGGRGGGFLSSLSGLFGGGAGSSGFTGVNTGGGTAFPGGTGY